LSFFSVTQAVLLNDPAMQYPTAARQYALSATVQAQARSSPADSEILQWQARGALPAAHQTRKFGVCPSSLSPRYEIASDHVVVQ